MAVPENIEELAHLVRTAIHGREVRESLASSMEATADVADWSRKVAQEIIDGNFNEGELYTEIERKLNELEADYAPDLNGLKTEVGDARGSDASLGDRFDSVDSQLSNEINNRKLAVNELEVSKANKDEVNDLADGKADKSALAQVANTKRDKDIEIGMADLDQETREAFTGGNVAVVGENSVGAVNLRSNAVTNAKLDKDVMIKTPWLNADTDDLDYVWNEGNYMVAGHTENNPAQFTAFLKVERSKTSSTQDITYVIQTVTSIDPTNPIVFRRSLSLLESDQSLNFVRDWVQLNNVTLDELQMNYPWLNQESDDLNLVWKSGTYVASPIIGNNPIREGSAVLTISIAKTQKENNQYWVYQTIKSIGANGDIFTRILYVNGTTEEVVYARDWVKSNFELASNPWNNKKWVALGTSMTANTNNYTGTVASELSLDLDNRGVGSGGITSSAGSGDTTMQAIESLEDFKGLLTVEIGPNDSGHPLGELGDTTKDTFYGCLYVAMETITKRTTARAVVLTMTNQWADINYDTTPYTRGDRRSVYKQWSINNFHQLNMYKAIKEVAQWFGMPVIDIRGESGLGGYHLNDQTSYDWIHHTELGGRIVGEYVSRQMLRVQPFPEELELARDL